MAMDKYVVLRVEGSDEPDVMGGVLGGAADFSDDSALSVETRSLESHELSDVRREPGVVGLAPEMPVALIAPVDTDVDAAAEAQDATWGLQALGALDSPFNGHGVTVAVLDTGIDSGHAAFEGKTIVEKDFTGDGNGDENGHGTHCAGTVFGGTVDGVRIGVAPGVRKALIGKVLNGQGSGSTKQILDGVLWAAGEGANVISMSIGLDFPGYVKFLTSTGLEIEPATSRALAAYRENVRLFDNLAGLVKAQSAMFLNTLLVAASGNESRRPQYEISTAPPAVADGIVAVGALGRTGSSVDNLQIANFSNTGPDIAAPGVAVRSAKPGGGLRSLNGTSMATPHVAGAAALWYEKLESENPGFKMSEFQGRLLASARRGTITTAEDRADSGAGLVRAPGA